MLKILGLSLLALLCFGVIIAMIVVNVRGSLFAPKVPSRPEPDEPRGPFTRPTAPANPGVVRTSREPDHTHMRSGTIYENPNPENEGRLRVRTTPIRTNLRTNQPEQVGRAFSDMSRAMADMTRTLHQAFGDPNPGAPGVQVTVTRTVEHVPTQQELEAVANAMKLNKKPKSEKAKEEPEVKRRNRYHRDPVI